MAVESMVQSDMIHLGTTFEDFTGQKTQMSYGNTQVIYPLLIDSATLGEYDCNKTRGRLKLTWRWYTPPHLYHEPFMLFCCVSIEA